MKLRILSSVLFFSLLFSTLIAAQARLHVPYKSPNAKVEQTIGLTKVTIEYSRPNLNNREVGKYVAAYGSVWRTGANHNTTLQISEEITLEGQKLSKGVYSLFTIPGKDSWEIIISKNYQQWGAFTYNPNDDLFRVKVTPVKTSYQDSFHIYFEAITDYNAHLILHWGDVKVPIKIDTQSDKLVQEYAKATLTNPAVWIIPNEFAAYANRNDVLLEEGLKWVEQSLAMQVSPVNLQYKAEILNKLGKYGEALAIIDQAIGLFKYAGNVSIKALILGNLERYNEAIAVAEEAMNIDQINFVFASTKEIEKQLPVWRKKAN